MRAHDPKSPSPRKALKRKILAHHALGGICIRIPHWKDLEVKNKGQLSTIVPHGKDLENKKKGQLSTTIKGLTFPQIEVRLIDPSLTL